MGSFFSKKEPELLDEEAKSADLQQQIHPIATPKKQIKIKHRRSFSLEGSIDFVRKYRDVGGMTFRRNIIQPIDVRKHIEDMAYKRTPFLPEAIVKRLPEMTENKKGAPGDTLPVNFGEKVDLVKMPYYIPSCDYLEKLIETIETSETQLPALKDAEEESKLACQNFSMYAYKSLMPSNIPFPKENWTAKNLKERDYYLGQCSWYQQCAANQAKMMKVIHAQHFYLAALIPEMKIAVENCIKVVANQAKVGEESTNLIMQDLWNVPKSDIIAIYKKLKRMILKLKLRWEKEMGISRTKEAMKIIFSKGRKKQSVERKPNCVITKCCNGECTKNGKECHKESFLDLHQGEMILSPLPQKTLIIVNEDTLAAYTDFSQYDPENSLSLMSPEEMVNADFFADEVPNTGINAVDDALHRLRNQMIILKWESYEVLNILHELYNRVKKINDGRKCSSATTVVLPFFSRYNFEAVTNALRNMDEVFQQIPTSMEICVNENENDSDIDLQLQMLQRDAAMQEKVSKVLMLRTPDLYTSAPNNRRMTFQADQQAWRNQHEWSYFH